MTLFTNVPGPTFTATGFVPQSDSAILNGVLADLSAAFGSNLNPALNTPQGQLASSEAASIKNAQNTFAFLSSMMDPAYNYGRWQDGIGRIYFMTRLPALQTTLQILCSGAANTVIPANASVVDSSGNLYSTLLGGTIGISGTVTLAFLATIPGPTPVPGSVSIYQAINGWDSAAISSGTQGQAAESRYAFEARRAQSVASNSFGQIGAALGAVAAVSGVTDYWGYDNSTGAPFTILGVTIPANALYFAVVGGTNLAVATAIWSKKAPGCAYYGNTTQTVVDGNPLFQNPPSYAVQFQRPTALSLYFAVSIVNSANVPSNVVTLVQNAILGAFAGSDGGPRARIASLLLATRYVAPVAALGPWALVRSLGLGSANAPAANFTATLSGTTLNVSTVSSGTLAVGQYITGAGIPDGTSIVAFLSGTGGVGTYTISFSGTIAVGEAMVAIPTNGQSVQVQANQTPQLTAADILVTVS